MNEIGKVELSSHSLMDALYLDFALCAPLLGAGSGCLLMAGQPGESHLSLIVDFLAFLSRTAGKVGKPVTEIHRFIVGFDSQRHERLAYRYFRYLLQMIQHRDRQSEQKIPLMPAVLWTERDTLARILVVFCWR